MDSLRIAIPDKLFAVAESLSFEGEYQLDLLEYCSNEYRFGAPCTWRVMLSNTGGAFLVEGVIEGQARTECVRCLDPTVLDLQGQVEGYVLIDSDVSCEEEIDEEEYIVLPDDHIIDLEPFLRAALLLALPLAPLCKEDCQGLCPYCGTNLNKESCQCAAKAEDSDIAAHDSNPFAILKTLTFDDE